MSCKRGTWAGRWIMKVGEDRRLRISFADFDELDSEDLTGTPTVTIESGSGVVISDAAVDGQAVAAWFDAAAGVVTSGENYTEYEVEVSVGTTGGALLVRSATLRLEA